MTAIAKRVGLSIDATNKRIRRLLDEKVFHPRIQIRPRNFGFTNIVDVKVKLNYSERAEVKSFLNYLEAHPRVSEIFTVAGEYDLSIVIVARDALDLGVITNEIRYRFGNVIVAWNESLTINSLKFETYDMLALLELE